MIRLPRHRALALLSECTGDDIWNVQHCRDRGVPEQWVSELATAFESGFRSDSETIYLDDGVTNQYHGVHDLALAIRIAQSMGMNIDHREVNRLGRRGTVQSIRDAIMDGDL
ncbi:hypothetical protein [Stieleria varia]|uniref:Uncharacterized protein n=1 Tax=Stieleria varia TaxID=2528005 RepID=A0A5C6B0Z6_9BACT|nr:hypothetical protein [Stieleria varia]TWU05975.1 hypothetical protein Pla52n_16910 [Stieleria varia]